MFALLYDPVSEITKSKKQSYSRILMYLIAASLFETAGLFFFAWRYYGEILTTNMVVNGIIGVLFALIALNLLVAFLFSFAMHILDGDGGYYEGLTTLVLAMVAPAIAIFFGGALTYLPYGVFAAILVVLYGYIIGTATLFRSGKELFELDYAGVFIGFLITVVPCALAVRAIASLL